MFELNITELNIEKENHIISKNINLEENLDVFILISSKDKKLWELLLNKILDSIIDKIYSSNLDDKFQNIIENINFFLNTWQSDWEKIKGLNACIWILRNNDLFFSTIWNSSCYLVKNNKVIEVTDLWNKKREFWLILNWTLEDKDIMTFSNIRLLDYLSKEDIKDGLLSWGIEWFNKNIKNILKSEDLNSNVWLLSFHNLIFNIKREWNISNLADKCVGLFDNKISKKIIALNMVFLDYLRKQSKIVKNVIFSFWIVASLILLYIILSSVIWVSQWSKNVDLAKQTLEQAKVYLRIASENIAKPEIFNKNIEEANKIICEIKDKKLFLNDVQKLSNDISILNKQFNWIESFEKSDSNLIYSSDKINDSELVIEVNNKMYVINKRSIVWPIIDKKEIKEYLFTELSDNDYFIDVTSYSDNIILLTKLGKVVNFSKDKFFNYIDVKDQNIWEESNIINTYSSNLYLLNKQWNQIFKHKKEWKTYSSWIWYLTDDDSKSLWKILSIAIDWWIYILKDDLSMVKLFKEPKYRLEGLVLNKLPKNYNLSDPSSSVSLIARIDLNYIYLFVNNRVLIFKPNTKRYQDVKSLTFLWQIEWSWFQIKDFFVNHDWEIIILWDNWLYKLEYEVSDDNIIIK